MKTPKWFLKKNLMAFLLLPVSWVYYVFSRLVYYMRKGGALKSRRKIICVGNILAGGDHRKEDEGAFVLRSR